MPHGNRFKWTNDYYSNRWFKQCVRTTQCIELGASATLNPGNEALIEFDMSDSGYIQEVVPLSMYSENLLGQGKI